MRSFALALAALVVACTEDSPPVKATPVPGVGCSEKPVAEQADCWTTRYFGGEKPDPLEACPGAPSPTPIDGTRESAFFTGPDVTDDQVRAQGARLQAFYTPYALTFVTNGPSAPHEQRFALDGTKEEFDAIPARVGVAPGAEPTTAQKAEITKQTNDVFYRNIRAFGASPESQPPSARVNIIVLEHIASPYVAKMLEGRLFVGLGLSPALFTNIAENDPSKNLFEALALPKAFTPM